MIVNRSNEERDRTDISYQGRGLRKGKNNTTAIVIKYAVFVPSEIYSSKPDRFNQKPQIGSEFFDDDGVHHAMYTRGNLERAIDKGYKPYVLLDTPLSEYTQWIVSLMVGMKQDASQVLEPELRHAFFPDEPDWGYQTPHPESYPRQYKMILGGCDCPLLMGMWKRLYGLLGEEWSDNFKTWDEARAMLGINPRIKFGRDFNK